MSVHRSDAPGLSVTVAVDSVHAASATAGSSFSSAANDFVASFRIDPTEIPVTPYCDQCLPFGVRDATGEVADFIVRWGHGLDARVAGDTGMQWIELRPDRDARPFLRIRGTGSTLRANQIAGTDERAGITCNKNMIPFDFFEEKLVKQEKLHFLDLPQLYEKLQIENKDFGFDEVKQIVDAIQEFVEDNDIMRFALDSVTSVSYRLKDPELIRDFLLRLGGVLSQRGCTSLLVSETGPVDDGATRLGVAEAIADGVIVTGNLERRGDLLRTLQVVKMRGTNHSRAKYVLDLTTSGVLLVPLLKGGSVTGGG